MNYTRVAFGSTRPMCGVCRTFQQFMRVGVRRFWHLACPILNEQQRPLRVHTFTELKVLGPRIEMNRSLRQGGSLALLVVCLAVSSRAAAQTPTSGWNSLDIGATLPGATGGATDGF